MPTLLDCACGKSVRAADEHAGKRVRCPGCGAVLAVPAAPPPPTAEQSDDFEVLDDDPAPTPAAKPARVRAVVEEEPPAPVETPKKKKKKKKKKDSAATEGDGDWYEDMQAREARMKRILRGSAFIALGVVILIGVGIAFHRHTAELKEEKDAMLYMIVAGIMGLLAIGKGAIGLALGQFLGDEE